MKPGNQLLQQGANSCRNFFLGDERRQALKVPLLDQKGLFLHYQKV